MPLETQRRFLSTPSARRATGLPRRHGRHPEISIHALREEGDSKHRLDGAGRSHFYPRPPRGGRQGPFQGTLTKSKFLSTPSARRATKLQIIGLDVTQFLSTPSARRATGQWRRVGSHRLISIHALREEGDCCPIVFPSVIKDFYPRPPRGGRQQKQRQNLYFQTNYTTFCTNLEEP